MELWTLSLSKLVELAVNFYIDVVYICIFTLIIFI